jgi:hypothetical protein
MVGQKARPTKDSTTATATDLTTASEGSSGRRFLGPGRWLVLYLIRQVFDTMVSSFEQRITLLCKNLSDEIQHFFSAFRSCALARCIARFTENLRKYEKSCVARWANR